MTKIEYIARYGEDAYKEHLSKCKKYSKKYNQENKKKHSELMKQWREKNQEYYKQYKTETQIGRANTLVSAYQQSDKKSNRGECTLITDWIINNIFTSKCVFCGESDWKKLGCDRIDNSKPHTEDNVQCCCADCNRKKYTMTNEEFINNISH